MNNDYLWDGSGTPDPDVQRLEALLGRLRSIPPVPQLPETPVRWRSVRYLTPMLAAAAAIIVMIGVAWQSTRGSASWEVASIAGQPRIGSTALAGTGRIAVGQTLVTDAVSRARMQVSSIGSVTIEPGTRVRLVETRDAHHQLALDRGTLHAVISAPPGQFVVDTPSARATDLGCAYMLHVDEDGSGMLSVTSGWVAFEFNGREAFVPAGASCRTHPQLGPGTPRYDDARQEYREALDEFDFGDPARRPDALRVILGDRSNADAVTLWHLISRVDAADRAAIVNALVDQLPMPAGVTREAVLRLDRLALDRWWSELGLGDADWWRKWKAEYPAAR